MPVCVCSSFFMAFSLVTKTAVDFSTVTVDLANNIPCLGLAPSLFDVDLGQWW